MESRRIARPVMAGALLLMGAAGAYAQREPATPLSGLERGQWQLKSEDGERKLCLTNPAMLLQVVHGAAQCEHFVVEQTQRSITIRYTCPGHGHGRTTVGVETARLVHVDTQGVLDGAPFSEDYEGRRIGTCG
ncbi:DUF3617 family protein [Sphingomonas sp. dw_22]|uniref:DUF3617 domain-containing protein n=1 Tax=Sphingomonas sp. dw_22 TaxID=2721175 RepID=UPI001BD2D154|nr:DUF3617 family protein [Sphingomonas sp. dw_22]